MGTDGARALLERAATLNLQTGNLLSWGCGRKKCPATPSEEVSAALPAPGLPRGRGEAAAGPGGAPGALSRGRGRWLPAGAPRERSRAVLGPARAAPAAPRTGTAARGRLA